MAVPKGGSVISSPVPRKEINHALVRDPVELGIEGYVLLVTADVPLGRMNDMVFGERGDLSKPKSGC